MTRQPSFIRFAALPFAITSCMAAAQQHPHNAQDPHVKSPEQLDRVVVRASPLQQTAADLTRPVDVLSGERLDDAKSATLGQTVEQIPGIQSSNFGPGVGRPIIRGLDGARVQVVSDGMGSGDVSTISADHAVSIEPFLANQIEVLKGPATLLYGSGAIGGAVNVLDGRTPDALPDAAFSGRFEARAGNVDRERTGMLRVDGATQTSGDGKSGFVFHFDGLLRETEDLRIPGYAESPAHMAEAGETPDPTMRGKLPNSALRNANAGLGVTWVGERGHLGFATSLYDSRYGVPGHEHADDGHGHGAEETHGDGVHIGLNQRRHQLHAGLNDLGPFKTLRFRFARTDYSHTEFEGGIPGTVYDNVTDEARLELVHRDVAGWQGAFGLQAGRRNFNAEGDEALVPATRTRDAGAFWMGHRDFGAVSAEAGVRADRVHITATPSDMFPSRVNARTFNTHSLSAALRWDFNTQWNLRVGLDRAQRAPTAEELYSNGFHTATGRIEIGNDAFTPETANRAELGLHWQTPRISANVTAFVAKYNHYLHSTLLADASGAPVLDGGKPIYVWQQSEARFHGVEAEAQFTLIENSAGHLEAKLFGDLVRGRVPQQAPVEARVDIAHGDHFHRRAGWLDNGGNLARMAPSRIGADLHWEGGMWRAGVTAIRTAKQDKIAIGETATPGYTWVTAHLALHGDFPSGQGWEVFVDGRNLLNAEARPHTSYLKDVAPLQGRGFVGGVRFFF